MMSLSVNDSGTGALRRVELKNGLVIGRHPECEVALADPTVGRWATKIVEDGGVFFFEDMGSSNPTSVVDGPTLTKGVRARLKPGLRIQIGRTTVDVVDDEADATMTARAADVDRTVARPSAPPDEQRTVAGPMARPAAPTDGEATMQRPAGNRGEPPPTPAPARTPMPAVPEPPPVVVRPVPAARPTPETVGGAQADDLSEGRTIGMLDSKPMMVDLATKAALETSRPRLVLTNEADRRVVDIARAETTIGRDEGDVQLNHGAVSSPHAKIRFNPMLNTFQIEDLDSRNKTYVRGAALNPKSSQTLDPECHVQFGPIECVFVIDRDADNAAIPPVLYANALRLLQGQKVVTKEQAERAEKQAATEKRHAGEVLLLSGAVTAKQWTRAVQDARSVASQEMLVPGRGSKRTWLYVGIVVGIVAVLYWVLRKPA